MNNSSRLMTLEEYLGLQPGELEQFHQLPERLPDSIDGNDSILNDISECRVVFTVKLTPWEVDAAIWYGVQRRKYNIEHDVKDHYGMNSATHGWQNMITAAITEAAFAKAKNVYWNADVGNFKAGDVMNYYEIRSSPYMYRNNARLRMHEWDKPDRPYILALLDEKKFEVHFIGWLFGRDGMLEKYWDDPWNTGFPAFWIKQHQLNSMLGLPLIPNDIIRSHQDFKATIETYKDGKWISTISSLKSPYQSNIFKNRRKDTNTNTSPAPR